VLTNIFSLRLRLPDYRLYRRYFVPVRPFTLAFRAMHYGRYGRNGDTNRLASWQFNLSQGF
jgi:hypothetical protein